MNDQPVAGDTVTATICSSRPSQQTFVLDRAPEPFGQGRARLFYRLTCDQFHRRDIAGGPCREAFHVVAVVVEADTLVLTRKD